MSSTSRKLLSINNYHYRRGGAEAVYFEHEALFRELGWDTAFFAMEHPDNVPCEQSEYFVSEIELGHEYSLKRKQGTRALLEADQFAKSSPGRERAIARLIIISGRMPTATMASDAVEASVKRSSEAKL